MYIYMYIYMYEYIGYNQIDLLGEPLSCCERTSPATVWRAIAWWSFLIDLKIAMGYTPK